MISTANGISAESAQHNALGKLRCESEPPCPDAASRKMDVTIEACAKKGKNHIRISLDTKRILTSRDIFIYAATAFAV